MLERMKRRVNEQMDTFYVDGIHHQFVENRWNAMNTVQAMFSSARCKDGMKQALATNDIRRRRIKNKKIVCAGKRFSEKKKLMMELTLLPLCDDTTSSDDATMVISDGSTIIKFLHSFSVQTLLIHPWPRYIFKSKTLSGHPISVTNSLQPAILCLGFCSTVSEYCENENVRLFHFGRTSRLVLQCSMPLTPKP